MGPGSRREGWGERWRQRSLPAAPELAPEPGADFILGCQRNQNGEKTKGKSYIDPSPTSQPRAQSKEQPRNQSKGPKEEGKVAHSLVGLCFARAPGAGMEVQASKRGRGLSLFVVITFCTSSRRSIMSQGRSLSALCPAIPLSVCPSIRPSAPAGHERKSVGLSGVLWSGFRFHRGLLAPFLTLSAALR